MDVFAGGVPQTIEDMAALRELRQTIQEVLCRIYGIQNGCRTLVMLSLVIPGAVKTSNLLNKVFYAGCDRLNGFAEKTAIPLLHYSQDFRRAGNSAFWCFDAEPFVIKQACCRFERTEPLGMLWDFDVFSGFEQKLTAKQAGCTERSCLVCSQPAKGCARSRTHTVAELQTAVNTIVSAAYTAKYSGVPPCGPDTDAANTVSGTVYAAPPSPHTQEQP